MAFSGIRLKKAIKDKGITQTVLAYRLGVDRSQITNWIKERYEPRDEAKEKIAQILEVSEAWLSGYETPTFKPQEFTPEQPELSEGEKELLALFKSVPDEHREMALQVVQGALSALKKK